MSDDETEIPAKAWVGVALRLAAFPVVFLWPAGNWLWWEAWAVVSLWWGYGLAVTLYLLRHDRALLAERMNPSPAQEGQKGWDKVLMVLIFPVGIGLFVVPGLDVVRFGWTAPLPVWVESLAMLAHLPAFLLIAWVMRENTYLSRVVKIAEEREHRVITTGPYALVRHPMYTAVIVLVLALPLALGSRYGLVPGALLAGLMIVRTALEDRTLHAELPGYPEYARKTRYRLIPGVW